jgi:type I restriction enzyme, S subunit
MNPQLLLAHFNRVTDGPNAIPRLRRFIFDLAVRGKLVEQDPDNETAVELLKRIQVEKARLVKAGKLETTKNADQINEPATLFALPASWTWCRLSEIGAIVGGGTPPSDDPNNFTAGGSGIAWLTPADLGKQRELFVSHGARDLTAQGLRTSSATVMPKGSVLFTSRAPIGYTAIARNDVTTNQGFKSVVPYISECNLYIAIYFRAFGKWIDEKASGTTFREVPGKVVSSLPFPLPPLAEQHCIASKIDELMALCDELEAARGERDKRRDHLTAASNYHLNNGAHTVAVRKYARFFVNHLPTIAAQPEQIPTLREAILNLAVRGRIMPQDDNDEPVSKLLERIRMEQLRLIAAGVIPKSKVRLSYARVELAFDPPKSWESVSFGQLCNVVTSGSRGWAEYYSEVGPKFIRAQNIRFGRLRLDDLACVNPPKKSEGTRTRVSKGDLLVVITGAGVTNPALLDTDLGEAYVSQHVALIKPTDMNLSPWLLLCLMASMGGRAELVTRAYGAGKPGLNLDNIRSLPIPLPPLAEQRRIVSKVNELMALCDRLEAQLANARAETSYLLESLLHDALTSPEPFGDVTKDLRQGEAHA